jgi:hypothetical protein
MYAREQIIWLAGKRHVCCVFGGGARLRERGWGADAHEAEAALCKAHPVEFC